ncbi:GlxA family transcriptional regulator [Actinokineospora iranica]|uniref:Transcriptional regulator GlxA family, contains an amidase domain and an AraC-type DNA-binding HTH domain n=1 Tax=Actinokineospora iranica TaxID=1271860 RepID=A0A1G6WIC1_9PSEU|nr:helix-turn-helix domain-containing protein [Actinokineospora iranica]SDD65632.1 Transcriptional regulator GlxA family, contains an amidase domain and an AraC-type DNA-binding HTH domain [Actinokineospora iranica]
MRNTGKGSGRVVVVVVPEVNLLDLAGPVQVFDTAAHLGGDYRLEHVGASAGATSAQGLALAGLAPLPSLAAGDLVLIPGPRLRADGPLAPAAVVDWLRAERNSGARFASVCSGAAVLGEAGLLDGRRCTTHWDLIEPMRRRYPNAHVQEAVLYVHDGPVSTSAGIASGVDLALSLVERDHGPTLTAAVARHLVVYLRRDGTRSQLSPFLCDRGHLDSAVHRVQDHIAAHLDARHTLADLAEVAHLSPRGLTRAFTTAIGMTPLAYRQRLRLDLASILLTETDLPVEAVATRCGFGDARHLRRLYAARFGTSPAAHR